MKQQIKSSISKSRRRFTLSIGADTLVALVLLLLLIRPRVLGFSFFRSGFPVFGATPFAPISITVQSKTLQDTYLLTASPQITESNIATRVIPDRPIYDIATARRTIATSGTKSFPGVQAGGTGLLDNSSKSTYSLPEVSVFTTTTAIHVNRTQSAQVPH